MPALTRTHPCTPAHTTVVVVAVVVAFSTDQSYVNRPNTKKADRKKKERKKKEKGRSKSPLKHSAD